MLEIKPFSEWSLDHSDTAADQRLRDYGDYLRVTHSKNGTFNSQTSAEIDRGLEQKAVQDGYLDPNAGEEEYKVSRGNFLYGAKDSFDSDTHFVEQHLSADYVYGTPEDAQAEQLRRYRIGKQRNSNLIEDYKAEIAPIMEDSDLIRDARISAVKRGDLPLAAITRADGSRDLHIGEDVTRENITGQLDSLLASGAMQASDLPLLEDYLTPLNGGLTTKARVVRDSAILNVIEDRYKADPSVASILDRQVSDYKRSEQFGEMSGLEKTADVGKQVVAAPFKLVADGILGAAGAIKSLVGKGEDETPEEDRDYGAFYKLKLALEDEGYSEAEINRNLNDFVKMLSGPVYRADKLQTAFDTDSNGNVLINPAVVGNVPLFESALEQSTLNPEQRALASGLRERLLNRNSPEMLKTILGESRDALDAYEAAKAIGKSDAAFVQEWLSDPDNYGKYSERAQQFGLSVVSAVAQLPLGVFALAGNEGAAKSLASLDKEAAERQQYSRLFGDEYGLGFQVINTIPQVATDILAGIGTGGTFTAAKAAVRQGVRGALRQGAKGALSQLDDSAAKSVLMSAQTGAGASRAFSAIGDNISKITGLAGQIAPITAVSFTRSSASTYGQLYGQLPADMSHGEKHKAVLGASIQSGLATALTVAGMVGIGRGGAESLATGTVKIGARRVPIEQLTYRQLKLLHEKTNPLIGKIPDAQFQRALRANLGSVHRQYLRHTLKGGFDEFAQETLDQALQVKVLDAYHNQETPFVEFANQITHAGLVGGILGTGTGALGQSLGRTNYSDSLIAAEARFDLLDKTVKDLRAAGADITASALEQQLDTAARELNASKSAESAAQIAADQADNPDSVSSELSPEEGEAVEDSDLLPPDTTEFLMDLEGVEVKHGRYKGKVRMDGSIAYLELDKPEVDGDKTYTRIPLGNGLDPAQRHVSRSTSIRTLTEPKGMFKKGTPFVINKIEVGKQTKRLKYALLDPMEASKDDFVVRRNDNGNVVSITALNIRNMDSPESTFQRTFLDPAEMRVLSRMYNLDIGQVAGTARTTTTEKTKVDKKRRYTTGSAIARGSDVKKSKDGSGVIVPTESGKVMLPPVTEEGKAQVIPQFNEQGQVVSLYFPKVFREGSDQRSVYVESDPARVGALVSTYDVVSEDPSSEYAKAKENLRKTISDLESRKARILEAAPLESKTRTELDRAQKAVGKAEAALATSRAQLDKATDKTREKREATVAKREATLEAARQRLIVAEQAPGLVANKAASEIDGRIREAQSKLAGYESGDILERLSLPIPVDMPPAKKEEIEEAITPLATSAVSVVLNNDITSRNKLTRTIARQSWDELTEEQIQGVLQLADYFDQQAVQGIEDGSVPDSVAGELMTTADTIRARVAAYNQVSIDEAVSEAIISAANVGDQIMAEYRKTRREKMEADKARQAEWERWVAGIPESEADAPKADPLPPGAYVETALRADVGYYNLNPDDLPDLIREYTLVASEYADKVSKIYDDAYTRYESNRERLEAEPYTREQFLEDIKAARTQAQQELLDEATRLLQLVQQSSDIDAALANGFETDVLIATQKLFDKPVSDVTQYEKRFITLDPDRQAWSGAGNQIDSRRTKFELFRTKQEHDLFQSFVAGGHVVSDLTFAGTFFNEHRVVVGKTVYAPFSSAQVDRVNEDSKYYNPSDYLVAKRDALVRQVNELYPETGYLKAMVRSRKTPSEATILKRANVAEANKAKLDEATAALSKAKANNAAASKIKSATAAVKKARTKWKDSVAKIKKEYVEYDYTYVVGRNEYNVQRIKGLRVPTRVLKAGGNPKNPNDFEIIKEDGFAPYVGVEQLSDTRDVTPTAVFTNNPAMTRAQLELNMKFQAKPKRLAKKRLNPSLKYEGGVPVAFYAPWDLHKVNPIYGGVLPLDPRLVGRAHKKQVSEATQHRALQFLSEGLGPIGKGNFAGRKLYSEGLDLLTRKGYDVLQSNQRNRVAPSTRLPMTDDGIQSTMTDLVAVYEMQFGQYRLAQEVAKFVLGDLTKRVRKGEALSPALEEYLAASEFGKVSTPTAEMKELIKEYTNVDQLVSITNILGFFKRRFPDYSYDDMADAFTQLDPSFAQRNSRAAIIAYAGHLVREATEVDGQYFLAPTAGALMKSPFRKIAGRYAEREKNENRQGLTMESYDERFNDTISLFEMVAGVEAAHGADVSITNAEMVKAFKEAGISVDADVSPETDFNWDSLDRSTGRVLAEDGDPNNYSERIATALRETVRQDPQVEKAMQDLVSDLDPRFAELRGDALVSRVSAYVEQGIVTQNAKVSDFVSNLVANKLPAQRKLAAHLVAAGWLPPSRLSIRSSTFNLSMRAPGSYNIEFFPIKDVSDPDAVIQAGRERNELVNYQQADYKSLFANKGRDKDVSVEELIEEHSNYVAAARLAMQEVYTYRQIENERSAKVASLTLRAENAKKTLAVILNMPDYGSATGATVENIEEAKNNMVNQLHNESEILFGKARNSESRILNTEALTQERTEVEQRVAELEAELGKTRAELGTQLSAAQAELKSLEEVVLDEEGVLSLEADLESALEQAGVTADRVVEFRQRARDEEAALITNESNIERIQGATSAARQKQRQAEARLIGLQQRAEDARSAYNRYAELLNLIPELESRISDSPTGNRLGWKQLSGKINEYTSLTNRVLQLDVLLNPSRLSAIRREVKDLRDQAIKAKQRSNELAGMSWVSMVNKAIENIADLELEASGFVSGAVRMKRAVANLEYLITLGDSDNYKSLAALSRQSPAMLRAKAKRGDRLSKEQQAVVDRTGGLSPAEAEAKHLERIDKARARLRDELEDQGFDITPEEDVADDYKSLFDRTEKKVTLPVPPPEGIVEFSNRDLGIPSVGSVERSKGNSRDWVNRDTNHSVDEEGRVIADIAYTFPDGSVVRDRVAGPLASDVLVSREVKYVRMSNATKVTYNYMDGSQQTHYMDGAPRPAELIESATERSMRERGEEISRRDAEIAAEREAKIAQAREAEVVGSLVRQVKMTPEEKLQSERATEAEQSDRRRYQQMSKGLPDPGPTRALGRVRQRTEEGVVDMSPAIYSEWEAVHDAYVAEETEKEVARDAEEFIEYSEGFIPGQPPSIFPSLAVVTGQSAAEVLASNVEEAAELGISPESADVGVALQRLATKGTPTQRAIAGALLSNPNLIQDTGFIVTELSGTAHAGFYDSVSNTVVVNLRGTSGQGLGNVVLHEMVHAATIQILTNPRNAAQRQAASRIRDLRRMTSDILTRNGEPVSRLTELGLENDAEFVTHALTTPEFQALLRSLAPPQGNRTLLQRIFDTIASFLGIDRQQSNIFDEVFNFTKMAIANGSTFNVSPASEAARQADNQFELNKNAMAASIATRFVKEKEVSGAYASETTASAEEVINIEDEVVAALPAGFDYEPTDRMLTAAAVRGETTVLVNLDQMNAMIRGLNPRLARAAIRSTIDEEIAHVAADSQFSDQDYANLAEQLGDKELNRLAHEYFSTAQDLDHDSRKQAIEDAKEEGWLTDADLAAEWVRQAVSRMATGTTREQDLDLIMDSPTLLQKFIRALREFVIALKERFTASPTTKTAAKISQAARVFRRIQNGGLEPAPEQDAELGDSNALLASLRDEITPGQESRVRFAIPIVGLGDPESKQQIERFWDSRIAQAAGIYNAPMAVRETINSRNALMAGIQRDLEWFNKDFSRLRDEALEAGVTMEEITKVLGTTEPIIRDEAKRRIAVEKRAFSKALDKKDPDREQKIIEKENELYHEEANSFAAAFRIEQQAMEEQLTSRGFGDLVEFAVEFRERMNEHKVRVGWESTSDVYLTRTYRYYNTPGWADAVKAGTVFTKPDGTEIDFGARRLLTAKALWEEETTAQLKREGLPLHDEILEQRVLEKLDKALEKLDERHAEDLVISTASSIRQDVNLLKSKNEVDPRLRELLGEVRDPLEIAARTMYSVGRMASNKMFYDNFEAVVLKEGIGSRTPKPDMVLLFPSKQTDRYGRLAGLYVRNDVAAALREELARQESSEDSNSARAFGKVQKFITGASGLAITLKTAGAVGYWTRNIIGGGAISLANGIAPLSFSGRTWQNIKSAFLGSTNRGTDIEERNEIRKLIDLGMLRDDTKGRIVTDMMRGFIANSDEALDEVFHAIMKAQTTGDLQGFMVKSKQYFGKAISYGPEVAANLNNFVDSYFKINAFYKELEYLQDHYQDKLPLYELEARAARKVQITFPTHSQTLDITKKFNRSSWATMFIPFLRWKTEIFRTMLSIPQLAVSEMRNGEFSRGFRRLAGFSTVVGGGNLIAGKAIAMLFGLLGDDEEEGESRKLTMEEKLQARLGLQKWQRQHALHMTKEGNKIRVIDLTTLMPYSQFTDMVDIAARNLMTGRGFGAGDIAQYIKNDILGTNIAATAVGEVLSNRDGFGEKIYYKEEGAHNAFLKMMTHIAKGAYDPGIRRKLSQSFREGENPLEVWLGEFSGARPYVYELSDLTRRGMSTIKEGLDGAVAARRPLARGRKDFDYEDMPDILMKSQAMLNENQRYLGQFLRSMESLGMERSALFAQAKKANISYKKVGYALQNKQLAWRPAAAWLQSTQDAINLADEGEDPRARFAALFRALDDLPDYYDLSD